VHVNEGTKGSHDVKPLEPCQETASDA
jgi:hypothetical protein